MIIANQDLQANKTSDKTSQKVLITGDKMMLVEFYFAKGGIGVLHKHDDHEQIGYVARGSFEITVGSETKVAKQGDCYHAAKNVWHGVVALEEDSLLVDTFTPIREDFLKTNGKWVKQKKGIYGDFIGTLIPAGAMANTLTDRSESVKIK